MTTIRITLSAIALAFSAFSAVSQASEITDFDIPTNSDVSRAAVRAEAARLNQQGLLRVDFLGPVNVMEPKSLKSREEVRSEAAAPRSAAERMAGAYLVGGN